MPTLTVADWVDSAAAAAATGFGASEAAIDLPGVYANVKIELTSAVAGVC